MIKSDECCQPLDIDRWNEKTHKWSDKLFLEDQVFQIMHIPVNMGSVVKRMFKKIEESNACPPTKDFLMLCYDPSPWKSQIYMTVTKNILGGKMAKISGIFISKVFEGPYQAVPKWLKEMDEFLASKKQKSKKYYIHYAYCPKCAKKFGVNHGIVFAMV